MRFVIAEKTVRHPQVLPRIQSKDLRRPRRLLRPQFDRPPRPQFATRQIDDPNLLPVHFFHQ
jgi:hypothetical protein